MSRKLLSSMLLLLGGLAANAQCPTGDLVITTQAQLDQFALDYPGCTNLPGSLYMYEYAGEDPVALDIVDLTPLSNLVTIGGDFDLGYASGLTSLDGLDNLQSVGGYFSLYYMNTLSDMTALGNLTTIGGDAIFYYNLSQTNFVGLENLESIGGFLQVQYNYFLEDFTGLSGLESIGNISATNNEMTSMDGFLSLTTVDGNIFLDANPSLANLNGLSGLTNVNGYIFINGSPLLSDISGLQNISAAGIDPVNGLQIQNAPLLNRCHYASICQMNEDGIPLVFDNGPGCRTAAEVVAQCEAGCTDLTIFNGTAWSNGVPDADTTAIIAGDLVVSEDLSACVLIAYEGVNVPSGYDLNIKGAVLTDYDNADLVMAGGANLLQNLDVANNGSIHMERSVDLNRLDYVYWGSPVTGQNLRAFSPATLENRFYVLNPAVNGYDAVFETGGNLDEDPATYEFVPGTGYMVRAPDNFPNVPDPKQAFAGAFDGTPTNGEVTVATTNGADVYHLLSNPYPSTIDADDDNGGFLDLNPGTLYFWTHTDQVSGADNYALYNGSGGTAATAGGDAPNGTIQVGQGFIFDNTGAQASVTFNNAMRVGNNDNQFFRWSNDKDRIWLNLARETVPVGQMMIAYMEGTSTGFDLGFDGKMLTSGVSLCSLGEGVRYGIQARGVFEVQDVVPLSLNATTDGNYTVSIDHVDGLFSEDQDIFLKDNLTGTVHDLKENDYTFSSAAGMFNERLQVQFTAALGTESPGIEANGVAVYPENNILTVSSSRKALKGVRVYDVRGRLLFKSTAVEQQKTALAGLPTQNQLLLVEVTLADGTSVIRKTAF